MRLGRGWARARLAVHTLQTFDELGSVLIALVVWLVDRAA